MDENPPPPRTCCSATLKQVICGFIVSAGMVQAGLVTGWPAVLPDLQNDTSAAFNVTDEDVKWIVSCTSIVGMATSILAGSMMEWVGPRLLLSLLLMPASGFWLLQCFAPNLAIFYVGRLGGGFIASVFTTLTNPLMAELVEPHLRGMLSCLPELVVSSGVLVVYVMSYVLPWQIVTGLCAVPFLPLFCLSLVIPESPFWLVRKGKLVEAENALQKLRDPRKNVARDELPSIRTSIMSHPQTTVADQCEGLEASSCSSGLDGIDITLPVTPKRKKEYEEEEKKKRRKQASEEGLERTPNSGDVIPPYDLPKSAKKKLLMGAEGSSDLKENVMEGIKGDSNQNSRKMLSPRKLTPSEIKEHLGKCGRLDQLRAKLLKVNQCGEKLKQFRENNLAEEFQSTGVPSPSKAPHPQLEKFASLDLEVPISPRKTPIKTPAKTPLKAPAHERFQYLIEKPSEELVLPYKYRFVKEVFRAVDTVVSLLHNRQEVITFSKLKSAVQEMLRKAFSERHLGEIKTVFPLAYFFKQDSTKNIGKSFMKSGSNSGYQLTINANMDYKPAAQNLMSKFNKDCETRTTKFRKMDSVVLVERRNIFHNSLINIVREHHGEFLKSLEPPIDCNASIKRWHPAFPLEDVPDIEPSPLPQPPVTEKLDTAQDILSRAHDLFSVNPRLEKAVVDAAASTPQKVPDANLPDQSTQPANVVAALKGVSASLLEKIRAREAAKAARDMTRSSSENKELEMLSRLPEISRIIRNIFVTEKKAALPWETVAVKIAASYPSMLAGSEVDSHLNLLIKEVPGWCTVHKVRSGVFIKIDKNEPQSNITDKLQAAIKQRQ